MADGITSQSMDSDDRAVSRFLDVLGGIFIVFGGQPVVTAIETGTQYKIGPATIICGIGVLLLLCGLFWHRIRPHLDTQFTLSLKRLASDARALYFVLLIAGSYVAIMNILDATTKNNEIAAVRNDEQSIAKMLDRAVIPRHLSGSQQIIIGDFLRQFDPHEYSFQVSLRDNEANNYRGQIEQALMKAGWTRAATNPYEFKEDLPEGLAISFIQTQEHSQKPDDPRNPRPDRLLMMAFGLAGVRVDSSGSGGGPNVMQDHLVISIGKRRMDSYALTPTD